MENIWKLAFELAFLSFLGLLYYFFQKKRIIKFTIEEIYIHADSLIYLCHEQIEKLKNAKGQYTELEEFVEAFEAEIELEEVDSLKVFMLTNKFKPQNDKIIELILDIKNMLGINPNL